MESSLQAAIQFVRSELTRLCEPTLHYTYIDGKSVIGDKDRLNTPAGNLSQHSTIRDHDGTFPDNLLHRELYESVQDGASSSNRATSIWTGQA